MEYAKLNNGIEMPMAGIGTFLLTPDEAQASVESALSCGYRLIDTANAYMNEKAVGRAMRPPALARGEIFLETKLWPAFYEQADAVERTLARLDTDYHRPLLIHQPAGNSSPATSPGKGLQGGQGPGHPGLSNFTPAQIREILDVCEVKPAVLQTEVHPYSQEKALKQFLNREGIVVQAWYPLGHGDKALLEEPLFAQLGQKYGKSPAQIILRWHIQDGQRRHPRVQEPGAHPRQLRPVRLCPDGRGDGPHRRDGCAEALLHRHAGDPRRVRGHGSPRGRTKIRKEESLCARTLEASPGLPPAGADPGHLQPRRARPTP